jgi:Myb-like DNA-binding domain
MSSPSGEALSGVSKPFEIDNTTDNRAGNGDFEPSSSQPSSTSDCDEGNSGTENELSSETEREILTFESELPKIQSAVPKRTPLPNSRVKRSASPLASSKRTIPKSLRPVRHMARWSQAEDVLLRRLKNRGLSWKDISTQLPGRNPHACSRRYHRRLSIPTIASRKGKWLAEEVSKLNGLRDAGMEWDMISKQLPGRTLAACRRKRDTLRGKDKSLSKPESKIEQRKPESVVENQQGESSSDEEMSKSDGGERPRRQIEERYSSSSHEEMLESEAVHQEPESKMEEEPKSRSDEDMPDSDGKEEKPNSGIKKEESDSSSDEDASESDSEDMAEKRRHHATFFLKR